jgi:hypothetical protein
MFGDGVKAAGVALVAAVAYLLFGITTAGDPQHLVDLELTEDGTTWPWHSSIQRASAAWINSPEGQQWATEATVEALPPRNIEQLRVMATASSDQKASKAAEDTAAGFLQHDFNLQLEPFQTERDAIRAVVDELRTEFDQQEQFGQTASTAIEIAARSARLEGTAALLGRLEGDLERAEAELNAVSPRYIRVDSQRVSPARDRLPETLKLLGGILILGWLVQLIRSGRFETSADAD